MNLSQTLRDERNELRIVSFTGLQTDASVAVFCRKQRCAQNFFFGQRVSADNVIVFADTAVTAVNRADIRDFNEASVINLIAHQLGRRLIGSLLKFCAVFRIRQSEQEHDILIG